MTDLAQNLLDTAAEHGDHPALPVDHALPTRPTGELLRRAVGVRAQAGRR